MRGQSNQFIGGKGTYNRNTGSTGRLRIGERDMSSPEVRTSIADPSEGGVPKTSRMAILMAKNNQ
ncbi:hypothetical protein NECAME_09152 [Necator americanus]|uniref:Uncharacterized protein n=1 Tax=Necator americanus TaxID=51031 RepID=W2TFV9_NECAM|nr:hypothetical protein NECAME_09152 [Necator americanus]ETN80479.1 hypothetical protein NECAME_09152 [Necator americanus]